MIQARYTEVLYNLLQNERVRNLINEAMSEYPVYTPENPYTFSVIPTREEINKRILDRFKYREIAFETVGRFIDELRITLNEIMPFYYQLFKTEDVMNGLEDIFGNLDVIESFTETNTSSGNNSLSGNTSSTNNTSTSTEASSSATSSATSQSNDKSVDSDTPQSQLGISNMNIDSVDYANNASWSKTNTSTSGTDTGSSTTSGTSNTSGTSSNSETATSSKTGSIEHTLTRKGNQGVNTYAHDMGELRNIFMNIINDILENPRLQELFMMIY